MKALAIVLFFLGLGLKAQPALAQNLVLDPSFEDTLFCPMYPATPYTYQNLTHWKYAGPFSGFTFNACNTGGLGIPQNSLGYEPAHSGSGYMGIGTYMYPLYAVGQLAQTLQANKRYRVSLFVSRCDSFIYSCNNLGVYLSDTVLIDPNVNGGNPILTLTHPVNVNFHQNLKSKEGWTKLDTTFIATGNERWITIGNFLTDAQSDWEYVGGNLPVTCCGYTDQSGYNFYCRVWSSGGAGYYLDDVSVVLDDDTGLEGTGAGQVSVYPNPNTGSFVLRLLQPGPAWVEVCNLLGEVVFATQATGAKETTLSTGLAKGVYMCRVIQEGRVAYQTKLMIQ